MLLEVRDLWVHHGRAPALKGVSLAVSEGSLVALVGPNGAGKSTLVRTISGLKRASAGEILFEGKRIDRVPAHRIVGLGIAHVPEGRRVFPDMTVYENLRMGAYRRLRRGRSMLRDSAFEDDLALTYEHFPRLKERARQRAGSLSGGEQQMLAIGRALMARPRLLLLDEPSIGLAPRMVQEIAQVIAAITRRWRVGILLIEQNARMAFRIAQHAYVLETGQVVITGATGALARNEEVKRVYLG